MARGRSRIMSFVTLALVCFAAYMIYSMDSRLSDLEGKLSRIKPVGQTSNEARVTPETVLPDVYQHLERADKALAKDNRGEAKAEIRESLDLINKAAPEAVKAARSKNNPAGLWGNIVTKTQQTIHRIIPGANQTPSGAHAPAAAKPAGGKGG